MQTGIRSLLLWLYHLHHEQPGGGLPFLSTLTCLRLCTLKDQPNQYLFRLASGWPTYTIYTYTGYCMASYTFKQHALTCTKRASQFTPRSANIHSEGILSCWVKVINHHPGISGVDSVDRTHHSPILRRGLIRHKVHRKPSCLMEGEWGPTDKGSSVADDPLHLHIAHLDSGS